MKSQFISILIVISAVVCVALIMSLMYHDVPSFAGKIFRADCDADEYYDGSSKSCKKKNCKDDEYFDGPSKTCKKKGCQSDEYFDGASKTCKKKSQGQTQSGGGGSGGGGGGGSGGGGGGGSSSVLGIKQIQSALASKSKPSRLSNNVALSIKSLPTMIELKNKYKSDNIQVDPEAEKHNANLENQMRTVRDAVDDCVFNCAWGAIDIDKASSSLRNLIVTHAKAKSAANANDQGIITRMKFFHMPLMLAMLRMNISAPDNWLRTMYDQEYNMLKNRTNNLRVWLDLSGILTGLLYKDTGIVNQHKANWSAMCDKINSDGTVDEEKSRGSKAKEYHEYYLQPLVYAAYILRLNHTKLHKLVNYVFSTCRSSVANVPWVYLYASQFGDQHIDSNNKTKFKNDLDKHRTDRTYRSPVGGYIYLYNPSFLA
jgi:hypothetical protein